MNKLLYLYPMAIALLNGNVYVSDHRGLTSTTTAGQVTGAIAYATNPQGQAAYYTEDITPYGGNLFLSEWRNGTDRMRVINSAGQTLAAWPVIGGLHASAIYNDEVYVGSTYHSHGYVIVYGLDGSVHRSWQAGGLNARLPGIAVYGNEVYVSIDADKPKIQVYSLAGQPGRAWTVAEGGSAGDITVAGNEVYALDNYRKRVIVFDLLGKPQRVFGGKPQFTNLADLWISGGEVYVLDHGSTYERLNGLAPVYGQRGHMVQVFDLAGNYRRRWGVVGLL